MRVIDGHLHLWAPNLLDYPWLSGPLLRRFSDAELADAALDGAEIEGAVFIQADCAEGQAVDEVRWVSARASSTGVRAIVAGARLDRGPQTSEHLSALAEHPLVVGVRHLLQAEPDGFAADAAFLAGAQEVAERGWSFDACVRARGIGDVTRLAARVPGLRIALDHLGKPNPGTSREPLAPSSEWVDAIGALAAHRNVVCKLSGLPAEAGGDWATDQVEPFLDAAADAFGPERLMWGSDWPVSAVRRPSADAADGVYQAAQRSRWAHVVGDWAERRGHDADAILWGNAERFYRVPPLR